MEVRPARAEDIPALLGLLQQLGPRPAATPADAIDRFDQLCKQPGLHLLVASVEGAVVATVTLIVVPNLTHGGRPWAQVENMVVDSAWRGKAVGAALLSAARDIAVAANCYKVQLQSADQREGAHRFYETNGYAATSKGFRLYLE